jgi:diguanylate cyclase (GGDEF)-like protein
MLTLFDLARNLSPSMRVADIADIISKHVRRLIPCSLSVFYLLDTVSDELVATHVAGEQAALVTGLRIPRGQRLSGWVGANHQTIRNSDPVLDFGESARAMTPRPRSCLSTPLLANHDLIGVLTLYSSNHEGFSSEHERVIEIVARQVAPTIRHAVEFESKKALSLRDQLTGLPNLGQFLQFSRSAEQSGVIAPASLLMIDVDNFKRINADFGRKVGDQVLSHVVAATRRILRPSDVLFRHEGDQFIAVLLHTAEATALALADQLRDAVAEAGAIPFDVSVSIGIAVAPRDASTFEGLLAGARERLSLHAPTDGALDRPGRIH